MMEQAVTYEAGAIDWHAVCAIEDITPGTGVCALVAGEQVALFYLGRQPGLFRLLPTKMSTPARCSIRAGWQLNNSYGNSSVS